MCDGTDNILLKHWTAVDCARQRRVKSTLAAALEHEIQDAVDLTLRKLLRHNQ